MNRFLEIEYGSPQCPEVWGDAQYARDRGEVTTLLQPLQQAGDFYHVTVHEPAGNLEGFMTQVHPYLTDPEVTQEENALRAYQSAYPDNAHMQELVSVERSDFLIEEQGSELFFRNMNGVEFSSTGSNVEVALKEGLEYYLSQQQ